MPVPGRPSESADTSLKTSLLRPRQRCVRRISRQVCGQVLLQPAAERHVGAAVSAGAAVVVDAAALDEGERQLRGAGQAGIVLADSDEAAAVRVHQLEAADGAVGRRSLLVPAAHPVVQAVGPNHMSAGQHGQRLDRRVRRQVGRDARRDVEVVPAAGALEVEQYGPECLGVYTRVDIRRDVPELRGIADDPRLLDGRFLPVDVELTQLRR